MRAFRWSTPTACLFAAAVLLPAPAVAQTLNLTGGVTLGDISSDEFDGASTSAGFFAGVGTSFWLAPQISLNPYVVYVQKGAKFDSETASYDYIEIPVLVGIDLPVGENLVLRPFAGPQIAFQINCDEDGFDCKDFTDHKGTEFGLVFGAGLSFGQFAVSAGYDLGLTDLYDSVSYKTRTLFAGLTYSVMLGGDKGM